MELLAWDRWSAGGVEGVKTVKTGNKTNSQVVLDNVTKYSYWCCGGGFESQVLISRLWSVAPLDLNSNVRYCHLMRSALDGVYRCTVLLNWLWLLLVLVFGRGGKWGACCLCDELGQEHATLFLLAVATGGVSKQYLGRIELHFEHGFSN